MADGLFRIGAIGRARMREYDAACLALASAMPPERIRVLRDREGVSQAVFAHYLGVTKNLVSDWERGVKKPGGPARRLLEVVERHGLGVLESGRGADAHGLPDAAE